MNPDDGRSATCRSKNYDNGAAKNEATGRRSKAVCRALENLQDEMADDAPLLRSHRVLPHVDHIARRS